MAVTTQIGTRVARDKRGLITASMGFVVDSIEETMGSLPSVLGLIEVGRNGTEREDKRFLVQVEYEGANSDGIAGEDDNSEYDSSFREEPIETHPSIKGLIAYYGGEIDPVSKRVTFSLDMPKKTSGSKGLGGTGALQAQIDGKNPLYGLSTYLVLSAVFRRQYIKKTLPTSIFSNIGKIVKSLPGGYPTPANHDWLIRPPKVSKRGGAYEISEEWVMSPPGGWPPQVYDLIQF